MQPHAAPWCLLVCSRERACTYAGARVGTLRPMHCVMQAPCVPCTVMQAPCVPAARLQHAAPVEPAGRTCTRCCLRRHRPGHVAPGPCDRERRPGRGGEVRVGWGGGCDAHTCMYAHMRACTQTHTHSHVHANAHLCTCTRAHAHTHTHTHTHTHDCKHAHVHARAHCMGVKRTRLTAIRLCVGNAWGWELG